MMSDIRMSSLAKKKHSRDQFTKEEDIKLANLVKEYGEDHWERIADKMPNRNIRQCKDRWMFYLSPNINKEDFSVEDDLKLIELYNQYGSQWKLIAKYFTGRTHISLRNRMNQIQRKILKTKADMCLYLLMKQNSFVSLSKGSISFLPKL